MLGAYRDALAVPGARRFTAAAFVARLPIAMIALGIVLLVSDRTGSYAVAGALSAVFQVFAAGGAVLTSRAVDRLGQGRLLPWLALVHAAGLVAFVAVVMADAPLVVQALAVAVAGVAQPAVGSMVRARWANAAEGDRLRSAFAWESILDELIFTVGPLLTATLAFRVGLPAPLVVAAALSLAGALLLAMQRSTQPTPTGPRRHDAGPRRSAIRSPGLLLLVVAALGVGGVFGSYEVVVVAFTQQAGSPGASGIVLGLWAFGSMLGGIVFGSRRWHAPLPRQVLVLSGVLTLVLVPAPFVRSVGVLGVTTFLAGIAIAPALIAAWSLAERLVPPALLTEGLTWANSGLAVGFSGGTALAGILVDAAGTSVAFALPIACGGLAVVVVALGQGVLLRASAGRDLPEPAVAWGSDPVAGPAPGGVVDDPR